MEDAGSPYRAEAMQHLGKMFISDYESKSESEQRASLVSFLESRPLVGNTDSNGHPSNAQRAVNLLLLFGMDAFQPWKRRVYSITLLGLRCAPVVVGPQLVPRLVW